MSTAVTSARQGRRVFVVGVGTTKFEKIETSGREYPEMVREAVDMALGDAGIGYGRVQRAAVGYVFQPSTAGQRALYEVGLTGIPIVNVDNNCATGSTALMTARDWVQGGQADVALAVGFEKMTRTSLTGTGELPKVTTLDHHLNVMTDLHEWGTGPMTAQLFGNAAVEHMERYGTTAEQIAAVAVKNHRHSVHNPYAQFRDEYTLEQVLGDKMIHAPLTRSQCSPTSDGAGAAVLVSEAFVREHGLEDRAVEIVAQALTTDTGESFDSRSMIDVVGAPMTGAAAARVFAESGLTVDDVDVIELHDCFAINEIITYEGLGLCSPGEGGKLVESGATTYGGRWVVNPSGGLLSKGHPLGATGLAQCAELTWQLRGEAGGRQVDGARVGLQHNLGLGGACVVTLYRAGTLTGTADEKEN
ncbi:lipid-transfer protein [Rhodococcus ruber]|uniref:lipid-transfer protein n=1 Tax=Rhodococcus TaxID=1827 RepID=UPI000C7DF984|nr:MULTISPECIES: lipid-transfer protein [Rhodococcus]RIK10685.1 MAG: Nonspecific lipid-transfer protein [Acidobacteriota bacterium]AUM18345.1 Nonspecific lipid-transfer protein [Rhodococcus ruber]MBD8053733.1 lipid-transfer protein [Rhodococcus ruber]MBP2213271.1 acetyl-CoA acetyltransferase [Rhodococcus ruber]MCF8785680.1 lipid-transfer protein [Rhodococcus ruber]